MNKPIAIIQDHRTHLLGRLTARSPLLNFRPSSYRIDVAELFKGVLPNPPAKLDAKKHKTIPVTTPGQLLEQLLALEPRAIEIDGAEQKILAKCRKIREQGDDWLHSTGQHSVYLGYPLVFIPLEKEKHLIAPLYLWNIDIGLTSGNKLRFARLPDDEESPTEPVFNRLLQTWLAQDRFIKLTPQDADINWDNRMQAVKNTLLPWAECGRTFKLEAMLPVPERIVLKQWAQEKEGPKILPSAILGFCPFKGQALLDDIDTILEKVKAGEMDLGVLHSLVTPRSTKGDKEAQRPPEVNQWSVTHTDPSQERILWQGRISPIMVLHGPPGTGKSQTIVNLIADALSEGKRIAVVCQKEAALEVVRRRLEAAGLGDIVLQVNEIGKERKRALNRIRDIEADAVVNRGYERKRQAICKELQDEESELDRIIEAFDFTPETARPRYGDILARIARIRFLPQDLLPLEKVISKRLPADDSELQNLSQRLKDWIDCLRRCDYSSNPWRFIKTPDLVQPSMIADIKSRLRAMLDYSSHLENAPGFTSYRRESAWYVEHDMAFYAHRALLNPEQRDAHTSLVFLAKEARAFENLLPAAEVMRMIPATADSVGARQRVEMYDRHVGALRDLSDILTRKKTDALLRHLLEKLEGRINQWDQLVEAATLRLWRREHEVRHSMVPVSSARRTLQRLRSCVREKRALDADGIRFRFGARLEPMNMLQEMNLTRLRTGSRVRSTTLRDLYGRGFDEVHRLFPVLLTNPDAACAMLPMKPGLYDLIIIDEASQMYTSDSFPILYRAKSVVISGDEKQMPPSDFFTAVAPESFADDENEVDSDGDEEEDKADENRLIPAEGEHCLLNAAVFAVREGGSASRKLRVHYRSDFPELIAFSNHAFYGGELLAPMGNQHPLPCCPNPIVLNQVGGAFERGENIIEAEAVIKQIGDLLRLDTPPSMGVVTFNIKQKDLINELLAERAEIDPWFYEQLEIQKTRRSPEGGDESLFVRSVEHVQGDERDLIIFSTTYDGSKRRMFGPITRKEKGRRRLNVAITRAKRGIIILTSLNIDSIATEEDREKSENYFLWKYLSYARAVSQGRSDLAETILRSLSDLGSHKTREAAESPFEDDVADFLRANNFWVDHQVGEGGFRIDLGVKRTSADRRYLCGIECDGKKYHSEWSARMNDIWRQDVLESKGWKIERVWSTDWFDNREAAGADLIKRILDP